MEKRNKADVRPLTPDLTGASYPARPSLQDDNKRLRALLKTERIRHARLEAALSRYQNLLEQQLQSQQTAVQDLRTALFSTMSVNLVSAGRDKQ